MFDPKSLFAKYWTKERGWEMKLWTQCFLRHWWLFMIKPGTNRYEKSGVYISLNVPLFKSVPPYKNASWKQFQWLEI